MDLKFIRTQSRVFKSSILSKNKHDPCRHFDTALKCNKPHINCHSEIIGVIWFKNGMVGLACSKPDDKLSHFVCLIDRLTTTFTAPA